MIAQEEQKGQRKGGRIPPKEEKGSWNHLQMIERVFCQVSSPRQRARGKGADLGSVEGQTLAWYVGHR